MTQCIVGQTAPLTTDNWRILLGVFAIYLCAIAATTYLGCLAFKRTRRGVAKSFGLFFRRSVPFQIVGVIVLGVIALAALDRLTDSTLTLFTSLASFALGVGGKALLDSGDDEP